MKETKNYKTWVEIDQKTLTSNLHTFQKYIGNQTLLAMIKCNAYGHGLVEVGKVCQRAKIKFVSVDTIDEAIQLRQGGVRIPILIISYTPTHRLESLLEYNLSQVVSDLDILNSMVQLVKNQDGKKIKVHLKCDTGMSRQGIHPEQVEIFIDFLAQHKKYIIFEGILTHFADADNLKDQSYSNQQLAKFTEVLNVCISKEMLPKYRHSFNTASMLVCNDKKEAKEINMCRAGIGIYGLLPSPDFKALYNKLKIAPILTWKTRIIQLKEIKKETYIGYGIIEKAKKDLKVAVLPVGYYEGIPRLYSSIGEVLIAGKRCRILGRVSMNITVVDISSLNTMPKVWDEVVIIGRQLNETITADEFAEKTKTINYEVVTRINPLIKRITLY